MDWQHLVTVCHPDISGRRVPTVRVTKEKGSRLPELRLSYTFCFYDETDGALHTVLHLPGKYFEKFLEVAIAAHTVMRYSGTEDPDTLALRLMSHNMRALPPDLPVKGHKGGPLQSEVRTSLGDLLKRKTSRTQA